ncbi:MAG: hypothetical protein ACRD41_04225 [Candidatus Acidiferrales bacterium]
MLAAIKGLFGTLWGYVAAAGAFALGIVTLGFYEYEKGKYVGGKSVDASDAQAVAKAQQKAQQDAAQTQADVQKTPVDDLRKELEEDVKKS